MSLIGQDAESGNPVRIEFSPTQTIPPGVKPGYFDEGFDLNRRRLEDLASRFGQPGVAVAGQPRLNRSRARRPAGTSVDPAWRTWPAQPPQPTPFP